MGLEPTTPTLARLYSTTELHPHNTGYNNKFSQQNNRDLKKIL